MKIQFTCRKTRLSPRLREFAEEKIAKLERLVGEHAEIHLILSVQKRLHEAEVTVTAESRSFTAGAVTSDLQSAIALVIERLERQLRRERRRRQDRARRASRPARTRTLKPPGGASRRRRPEPRVMAPRPQAAKPMTVDEAAVELDHTRQDFLVFRNSESERMSVIYRLENGQLGLIEAD